jgi:hypothetical protein
MAMTVVEVVEVVLQPEVAEMEVATLHSMVV